MNTKIYRLDGYIRTGKLTTEDLEKLAEAAAILAGGGLVAFPTETVYGLGGNALSPEAAAKIYAAKGRPSDNPLIVHIASMEELEPLVSAVPEGAARLAARYWPGPMTMIFPKSGIVPDETTGGLSTVAVRYPSHPAANALIRMAGVPVAAPSANRSGRPSTTKAAHCVEDLDGRVDAIIDGGDSDIGLESTIIDVTGTHPQLLRPGAVTLEMIEETLHDKVTEDAALLGPLGAEVRPKAPGMKYRHYAPKAPMILVTGEDENRVAEEMLRQILKKKEEGRKTALICSGACLERIRQLSGNSIEEDTVIRCIADREAQEQWAHELFESLREMDETDAEFIIAEGCSEQQLGRAIMNRMKKAAAWQIIEV